MEPSRPLCNGDTVVRAVVGDAEAAAPREKIEDKYELKEIIGEGFTGQVSDPVTLLCPLLPVLNAHSSD